MTSAVTMPAAATSIPFFIGFPLIRMARTPYTRNQSTTKLRQTCVERRFGRSGQDDDPVVVARYPGARCEGDPAERDRHVALAGARLGARFGMRAERLDPDLDRDQRRRIAHAAVDDQTGPAVVAREGGDVLPDERDAKRARAVDDEDPSRARLRQLLPE